MELKLLNKELSPNKEVVKLTFKKPDNLNFIAGQFLMFDNGELKRAYSIASSPDEKELSFYVKKASENGMSKYLVEDIKVGDTINYMGPFGHMKLEQDKNTNYLLISTGSGLAPILSIYKTLIINNSFGKIVNLYGERYYNSMVESVFNEMRNFEKENVKNYFYLSREEKNSFLNGYVQNSFEDAVKFLEGGAIKVYICGKPSMVDESIEKLESLGINKDFINFEKF